MDTRLQSMLICNGLVGGSSMLIDVLLFGLPLVISFCMAAHAIRDEMPKFWIPAFSMFSYCVFYLLGGREVILYLGLCLLMGGGLLNSGGLVGP